MPPELVENDLITICPLDELLSGHCAYSLSTLKSQVLDLSGYPATHGCTSVLGFML